MLRSFVCAGLALVLGGVIAAVAFAADIRAVITSVDPDKGTVTFKERKGKGEFGDSQTLPVAKDAKIVKGTFDKETKMLKAGDPIEGALKADVFSKDKIGEKGVGATITTTGEGDKATVTQIIVGGGRGKKGQ